MKFMQIWVSQPNLTWHIIDRKNHDFTFVVGNPKLKPCRSLTNSWTFFPPNTSVFNSFLLEIII
jgi:hypothetical protein